MNISVFFERDLDKLIQEINSFKNEKDIWKIKTGITNSAGNLTAHLLGNLNHFIGKVLGNTDYVRNRDEEFSIKDLSREKLIEDIHSLKEVIKKTLPNLSSGDLKKEFPIPMRNEIYSTENMLTYLLAHLNYHLGQVNYLRRMLEAES